MQLHENEVQVKRNESATMLRHNERTQRESMFELRHLLSMQQRMSNK